MPTAFPAIKDTVRGGNWLASYGDTIESEVPIAHYQLELVTEVTAAKVVEEAELVKTPAAPESQVPKSKDVVDAPLA
jgi:hypothetical protein